MKNESSLYRNAPVIELHTPALPIASPRPISPSAGGESLAKRRRKSHRLRLAKVESRFIQRRLEHDMLCQEVLGTPDVAGTGKDADMTKKEKKDIIHEHTDHRGLFAQCWGQVHAAVAGCAR